MEAKVRIAPIGRGADLRADVQAIGAHRLDLGEDEAPAVGRIVVLLDGEGKLAPCGLGETADKAEFGRREGIVIGEIGVRDRAG